MPATRREFLLAGLPLFGWLRPRRLRLDGLEFRILRHGRSRRRYLVIHGNERTARQAVIAHLEKAAGTAYLCESPERYVTVAGGRLDPNRMFSREGAEASYRRLNPKWDEAGQGKALDFLDSRRPGLLKALLPPKGGLLIAAHNNGPGYSLEDEVGISTSVWLPRRAEPHEFFLVTSPSDFARLSGGPYNVLLQDRPPGPDDGSLSRLCAARGVRYANLEVALGKLDLQVEMLAWLDARLA
jgi:hypothetical protein